MSYDVNTEQDLSDIYDQRFVFEFEQLEGPGEGQRWTTWLDVERGSRGPDPWPDWVVTEQAAIDTELGVLKTGKEADVFLLERAVPGGRGVLMAAKRYRSEEHRSFHRSTSYTEGRRTRNTRDTRALAKKTAHGSAVAAGQWAYAEWDAMCRLWWPRHRGWPRSGHAASCCGRTSTSSATPWPSWPGPASHTATCRRTTSLPKATVSC